MGTLSKKELVSIVVRLQSGDWDDEEMDTLFQQIDDNVSCSFADIQGFIFHSEDDPDMIVDKMLAIKPIQL